MPITTDDMAESQICTTFSADMSYIIIQMHRKTQVCFRNAVFKLFKLKSSRDASVFRNCIFHGRLTVRIIKMFQQ